MPNFNNYSNGYYPQPMSAYPSQMPMQNNAFGTPQMQMPQQPQQETVIDWVMGRSGAEAYLLKPNTNGFLMDSNNNGETVYTKSTDMSGRYSPLRSYRMVPFEESSQTGAVEPIDYEKIRSIVSDEVTRQMEAMTAPNHKKEGK